MLHHEDTKITMNNLYKELRFVSIVTS